MNKITLHSLHKKKISEINEHEKSLPELRSELQTLVTSNANRSEIIDMEDKIAKYEGERNEYLLDSSEAMFRYIEGERNRADKKHLKGLSDLIKPKIAEVAGISDRMDYYNKYRSIVDPEYVYINESIINDENYCSDCSRFRTLNPDDGVLICEECASQVTASGMHEKPTTKDHQQAESRVYEYKRYVYFCNYLDNLQGKESRQVPQEVLNAVMVEIRREKMENKLEELTDSDIRRYLKKYKNIKYNRWYDHTTQILFKVTNITPILMTPEMEQNFKILFIQIQEPFELYKGERLNFSTISFIVFKFCQLLGYTQFQNKLRLHKNPQLLYKLDMIWKKICHHLGDEETGWTFQKSYNYC
jgi:hypothetical protein